MKTGMTLRRSGALLLGTAAAVGITMIGAIGTASAGDQPSPNARLIGTYILFQSMAPEDQAIADAIEPELFFNGSDISEGGLCTEGAAATPGPGGLQTFVDCTVPSQEEYTFGIDGIPDGYFLEGVSCSTQQAPNEAIDDPEATVTPDPFSSTECTFIIAEIPTVYIDKVVTGDGDAAPGDFTLEVFDDTGTLVDGTLTDPSTDTCTLGDLDDTKCAAVQVLPGDYALGEVLPDYGYVLSSASCVGEFDDNDAEIFPSPVGEFTHGEFLADTLCTVTNDYVTQPVTADLVVVNDDGGTATGADFTIEVFDNTGTKVDEGPDPEPGTGNASAEFDLAIGDYTFGVAGPDGYTSSAVVSVEAIPTEIIGTGADFTVSPTQTASGVITVDDQVAPTTTTTTTTLPATTTTTTIAATLPETGGNSQVPMLLIALVLLGLGGGAVAITRRA